MVIDVVPLVDDGLGNSAYLVDLGEGRGLVVDAGLDLRSAACRRGEARATRGLRRGHPPARRLPHRRRPAGRRRRCPGHRLRAGGTGRSRTSAWTTATRSTWAGSGCGPSSRRGTPTSTWPTCCWTGRPPVGVFTGGSLIVGVGCPHRPASAPTGPMSSPAPSTASAAPPRLPARRRRRVAHPRRGFLLLRTPGAARTSDHRGEKATNPLLAAPDEDDVRRPCCSARWAPTRRTSPWLGEVNRRGPAVLTSVPPAGWPR